MNYLIAVLTDRTQAEAAYSALAQEGLPNDGIDILGDGYQSADEYCKKMRKLRRKLDWLTIRSLTICHKKIARSAKDPQLLILEVGDLLCSLPIF